MAKNTLGQVAHVGDLVSWREFVRDGPPTFRRAPAAVVPTVLLERFALVTEESGGTVCVTNTDGRPLWLHPDSWRLAGKAFCNARPSEPEADTPHVVTEKP